MASRGKRLSNSFDRAGIIGVFFLTKSTFTRVFDFVLFPQHDPHSSVDDASLYKHIDSELPDRDRASTTDYIMRCTGLRCLCRVKGKTRLMNRRRKGAKLLQELKDDVFTFTGRAED